MRYVRNRYRGIRDYLLSIGLMMVTWLAIPFLLLYMAGRALAEWSRRPGDE